MSKRIEVTHSGSLPRVGELSEANARRATLSKDGVKPEDTAEYNQVIADSVRKVVEHELESGISIVNDGEYGKSVVSNIDAHAWIGYIEQRVSGWAVFDHPQTRDQWAPSMRSPLKLSEFSERRDRTIFNDVYTDPNSGVRISHQTAFPRVVKPLEYQGYADVKRDIRNLKSVLADHPEVRGFISSVSPGSASRIDNEYYKTEEEHIWAWADALHEEYKAITDAGLILQVDDPSLAENWDQFNLEPDIKDYQEFTAIRIEALNHALRGIPAEQVRLHVCWGSWHGPHTTDIDLKNIVQVILKANVRGYLLEGGNARHEHEWAVWQDVKLPDGKILIPGVVSHSTNVVEHPELVAQRIERYARLVGPERVVAGTDCGLGGRVHPHIAWAKLKSLSEGAALASARLFPKH